MTATHQHKRNSDGSPSAPHRKVDTPLYKWILPLAPAFALALAGAIAWGQSQEKDLNQDARILEMRETLKVIPTLQTGQAVTDERYREINRRLDVQGGQLSEIIGKLDKLGGPRRPGR